MDENVPLHSVRALRAAGHDVYSASETAPGALDETLLAVAHAEQRLIVTFDRDFGELAVRLHRGASGGIMLLRLVPHDPVEVTQFLSDLLARTDVEWAGRLSVIDRWHVRQRRLESRVPPIELGAAANEPCPRSVGIATTIHRGVLSRRKTRIGLGRRDESVRIRRRRSNKLW